MKKQRSVSICTGGGGPAEPTAERHPQCDPSKNLTIDIKQSELADDVKSNAKDGVPAPVRVSETGRARNWTMPPLRLERECKERTNSATIDNRCVEFDRRENQRCAFTMAEILLSLTIIGVVAAITLPSLTGNINERTWNTQRKALYARFSQAIALMPALNGYGTLKEETDSAGSTSIEDTAAETFVTNGLSKVMKINNICDNEHLEDCGIPKKMISMTGNKLDIPTTMSELSIKMTNMSYSHPGAGVTNTYSQMDTKAAAFETINGESVLVFYNPNCQAYLGEVSYYLQPKICANFIFDLNGSKGPNTIGKDLGVLTVLYSTDSVVVSPQPYTKTVLTNTPFEEARKACGDIEGSEYRLPNRAELASMFVNNSLFEITGHNLMSLDFYDKDRIFFQSFNTGQVMLMNITTGNGWYYRCVKRY